MFAFESKLSCSLSYSQSLPFDHSRYNDLHFIIIFSGTIHDAFYKIWAIPGLFLFIFALFKKNCGPCFISVATYVLFIFCIIMGLSSVVEGDELPDRSNSQTCIKMPCTCCIIFSVFFIQNSSPLGPIRAFISFN